MTRSVRLLRTGAADPAYNLALDEALLLGTGSALRFYSWEPPGLSLGYFQPFEAARLAPWAARGLVVVRRPTGGGAIAHVDELTFSLTGTVGEGIFPRGVRAGTERLHGVFLRALGRLGIPAVVRGAQLLGSDDPEQSWLCFYRSSRLDLAARRRKLLGSAQRRVGRRVLHHGSLPLGANPVTPGAASLEELGGRRAPEEVVAALVREFVAEYGVDLVPAEPEAEEREAAARLRAEKYATAAWTRGTAAERRAAFDYHSVGRTDAE